MNKSTKTMKRMNFSGALCIRDCDFRTYLRIHSLQTVLDERGGVLVPLLSPVVLVMSHMVLSNNGGTP